MKPSTIMNITGVNILKNTRHNKCGTLGISN